MSAGVLITGLLSPAECLSLGEYTDERLKAPRVSIEEREPGEVSVLRNTAADAVHPRDKPGGDVRLGEQDGPDRVGDDSTRHRL